uniref:uridine/cytidine kinase n=1 Tax=Cyprinus carpio TaxID=7962 RepID=A0A8C2F303_CYPCA
MRLLRTNGANHVFIGLCGGSASGKTTVANKIIEALDVPWVVLLSMDSFYKVRSERVIGPPCEVNLVNRVLLKVFKNVYGASVIIFECILSFADKELLQLMDMKIFVDTDSYIRLVRQLRRDITERGCDIEAFEQYIEPTMRLADIVVPRGGNMVAIDLIVQHVHSQLEECEISSQPLPQSLSVLESTPQVRGLHTIIRNKDASRDEFIFYSKRLMRLLIEHALSFFPSKVCVYTLQGQKYEGRRFSGKGLNCITGVSILRAGETMEPALRAVWKDVCIGKILIQTNLDSGEPELHYLRLPRDISEDHVILMAAMMAVRVLLVQYVAIDLIPSKIMKKLHYVLKSCGCIFAVLEGDFGDRYFGTDGFSSWSDQEPHSCSSEV